MVASIALSFDGLALFWANAGPASKASLSLAQLNKEAVCTCALQVFAPLGQEKPQTIPGCHAQSEMLGWTFPQG
jgi:hypothetical protein